MPISYLDLMTYFWTSRYIHLMISLPTCALAAQELRQQLENATTCVNQQTTLYAINLRCGVLFFIV